VSGSDSDGDGINDSRDADMDGDGIWSEFDADLDGDGFDSSQDVFRYDPRQWADRDRDG